MVTKPKYDCSKCPGYCCTYELIEVKKSDIQRLAKHFGITYEQAERRFTKTHRDTKARVLRHRKDETYGSACMNLDPETRRCTVYDARPGVCREYPTVPRCGYFDFIQWERNQQGDETFIPFDRYNR